MVQNINDSSGVLSALKHLQSSRRDAAGVEARLSSGHAINSARDNAAVYQTSEAMNGDIGSLSAVTLSLGRAKSVSDMAMTGAEQVSKLLINMRATAMAAMGEDLTPEQRVAYAQTFDAQKTQLASFINNASFDETNLLNGSKPTGARFVSNVEATQAITLAGRDFRLGGPVVTLGLGSDLISPAEAEMAYSALEASIANVGDQLTEMAGESKRIEAQMGFVSKLADALAAGVGRLVDTDVAAESALIQALQVKQALSAEAISIVNSAPQALLALFR
jgi:flagellin